MIRIPAIDIIDGQVVRLTKGDFDQQTHYNSSALDLANAYQSAGATKLHIVDLDAARGRSANTALIKTLTKNTNLHIQVGGGIRSTEVVEDYLSAGVAAVIVGSKAVSHKEEVIEWIQSYGKDKIIVGADVRDQYIAVDGWHSTSDEHIDSFVADYMAHGAEQFLCTDIARDGTLTGPADDLYSKLISTFPTIKLIASGGVADLSDIERLESQGLYAVVIGKALLEGRITADKLY